MPLSTPGRATNGAPPTSAGLSEGLPQHVQDFLRKPRRLPIDGQIPISAVTSPGSAFHAYTCKEPVIVQAAAGNLKKLTRELGGKSPQGLYKDGAAQMGPLTSAEQHDKVLGYLSSGLDAGARAPAGGYQELCWGREMAHNALDNYLDTKSVVTQLA